MYPWKRGSIGFSYFPSLIQRHWGLCVPSTRAGTQERRDPNLVSDHVALFKSHTAWHLTACVQLVPSVSHIPWRADQMWSAFAQECLYLPPSLILLLAGLKACLNDRGLPHHALGEGGEHDLFLKVVFLFSICLFYLCARLVVKVFREFPEGTFRKWLILFAEILSVYKTSICNLVVMSLSIYSHCVKRFVFFFSFSVPLPPGFPVLVPVHLLALLCSFFILTCSLTLHAATEIIVGFLTI